MEAIKIRINDDLHFLEVQKAAFDAGVTWYNGNGSKRILESEGVRWIFIYEDNVMTMHKGEVSFGEEHKNKLATIDYLKPMSQKSDPEPEYKPGSMIYVASPYSAGLSDIDSDTAANVLEDRYEAVKSFVARHMKTQCVFSPIVHAHSIAWDNELPKTFEYWAAINHDYLIRCSELWVLTMPDWDVSRGVADEIRFAIENGIPVKYINDEESV